MIDVTSCELIPGSTKERMQGMEVDFPYIASRAELDCYSVPWHWHEQVELFYVESGELEYFTPGGTWQFPAGSGGFVNRNVLHRTEAVSKEEPTVQWLHIFDLSLISGQTHGRIEREFFTLPLQDIMIIPMYPQRKEQSALLEILRDSFSIENTGPGYELRLCATLLEIWAQIIVMISKKNLSTGKGFAGNDEKIKQMILFIHNHYSDKIAIREIASAGLVSQRACFRIFQEYMRCTPVQYCVSYRLHRACRMLTSGDESITEIALSCGFGNSSYFGKKFADSFGYTPSQYRQHWQDKAKNRRS